MRINLIPMAGAGSRFTKEGYKDPKPLIDVSGEPMIVQATNSLPEADKTVFVCRTEHLQDYPQLKKVLETRFPLPTLLDINYLTEGQASTCLLAEDHVDPEDSLMIGACDNGMTWDKEAFKALIQDESVDAIIFTFRNNATVNNNPKAYGWVKVDDNNTVQSMSVKVPISDTPNKDHAVVGSFWFRRGKDFIEKTKQMIQKDRRINNEFYVDKVFDEFVEDGMKVKVFEIDHYICWGTPNDLKTYQYWEKFFQKYDEPAKLQSSENKTKLSIVVPCYNEEKNIPLICDRFEKSIQEPGIELLLVNNGSTDNSNQVFQETLKNPKYHFIRVVDVPVNQGYGFGITSGLEEAKGEILAWTHADMQTDPGDVIKAYHILQESQDPTKTVVKGKRIKRSIGDTIFTFGMSVLASAVLRKALFDINAQPKLFPRKLFNEMKSPPKDFSLDLYWLYFAKKRGYKVIKMPVLFTERIHGESKWNFSFKSKIKTIWRTVKYIFALPKLLSSISKEK